MRKLGILIPAICSIFVAACGQESAVQKVVRESLIDPGSAKFGKSTFTKGAKGESYACLTVNSKNRMGGYTGDQQAVLVKSKDEDWMVVGTQPMTHDQCVEFVIKH